MYKNATAAFADTTDEPSQYKGLFPKETRPIASLAYKTDVAKRIKALIALKGLTQEKVAAQMGLTKATLCNKINGNQIFTLPEAVLISRILSEDFKNIFFK